MRGDVVNLMVRFRLMKIGKALLSTQGPGSFGHSHDAREETLCLTRESQAQTSPRVAVH